ncbi:hypothetical protein CEK26_003769 [Fusarium fujikuroi]|nr:hypothetical protein CEK27_003758 [Fusarium fujikuroi]QGJ02325.1 hypothetical protein CEK26_003769 [Fusarium fujikuroi]
MEKPPSPTLMENASIHANLEELPIAEVSWLESKLKPKTVHARYPFKGKPLLWITCAFRSIVAGLLVNLVFLSRFFSKYGGADGTSENIDPSIIGILVTYLQVSAALGSLIAGSLGNIIGRKRYIRLGSFIYFTAAFI